MHSQPYGVSYRCAVNDDCIGLSTRARQKRFLTRAPFAVRSASRGTQQAAQVAINARAGAVALKRVVRRVRASPRRRVKACQGGGSFTVAALQCQRTATALARSPAACETGKSLSDDQLLDVEAPAVVPLEMLGSEMS